MKNQPLAEYMAGKSEVIRAVICSLDACAKWNDEADKKKISAMIRNLEKVRTLMVAA